MLKSQRQAKTIGIPAWTTGDSSYLGVKKDYISYARLFGNVRILSLYEEPVLQGIDLLLLPGGADVNPARYGQIPELECGGANIFLEGFDIHHLPEYINAGVPVFGICRGLQTLNVHFGGTLTQEIGFHPSSTKRDTEPAHELDFTEKYRGLARFIKKNKVTSRHHQAIEVLGEGLEVVAIAGGKEMEGLEPIPEVIFHNELNIAAVQYHPESNVEEPENLTTRIIHSLLNKDFQEWRTLEIETQLTKRR